MANWLSLRPVSLCAFALLGGVQLVQLSSRVDAAAKIVDENQLSIQRALACGRDTLPPAIGALTRVNFEKQTRDRDDQLGRFSRTFEYRDENDTRYIVSCDFPYPDGWHELTTCYRGLGWKLDDRRVVDSESKLNANGWQTLEADFSKPDGSHGLLMASAFDDTGQAIELPTHSLIEDTFRAIRIGRQSADVRPTFQVQVWITAGRPVGRIERETAHDLLSYSRQRFHDLITTSASSNGPTLSNTKQ